MDLIPDFASYLGLPLWFVGGVIGLVAVGIVLAVAIYKFRIRGLALALTVAGVSAINWLLFAWPLWAVVVTAVAILWEVVR
ncbi:MAG: hypothetical protein ACE5HJ_09845 [Thermoplasmata archaeon]